MTLQFNFKRVYGKPKFYPLDEASQVLLSGKKCFSGEELKVIMRFCRKAGLKTECFKDKSIMTAKQIAAELEGNRF